MNQLLTTYLIDVKHPNVSGIEHLQMLENRSKLARMEQQLTLMERRKLAMADRQLARHAHRFLQELSQFINLAEERRRRQLLPNEWWWYLDVMVQIPAIPKRDQMALAA
jgi:hypothetical protein